MKQEQSTVQYLPENTILNGQYLVKSCLGSGGFGITYLADHLKNPGMRVAIKEYFPRAVVRRAEGNRVEVIPSAANEYGKWRENYEREYGLLRTLKENQAVVRVLDLFRENNTTYLVMEYITGQTLEQQVIEKGRLKPEQVLTMLYPLLPELAGMHDCGILHRDINPSNLMLIPGKTCPKLIDFGSARPLPADGGKLTTVLRPGYAPPEQYHPDTRQGPQEDVYGLCATMYFALTGQVPPPGNARVFQDTLKPLSTFIEGPKELVDALTTGMQPDAAARPGNFHELWKRVFPSAKASKMEHPSRHTQEGSRAALSPTKASVPAPSGARIASRITAAGKAVDLYRHVDPRKAETFLQQLEQVCSDPNTPEARVRLEESILEMGKPFAFLCLLFTRN